jgi:5-methylcytosine-specific restriction endonuclease McrA
MGSTKPTKPKDLYPYGYVREDGLSYFGLECRLYKKTGWRWIERWRDAEKHRISVIKSINKPENKIHRKEYNSRYRKTDGFKAWEKSRPWYAESRRRIVDKYHNSEHGIAKQREYLLRPLTIAMRRERGAARRTLEKNDNPLLKTIMRAIYDTSRTVGEITGIKHHVDHIIPLSRGGKHVPWNLNPIPWIDNLRKHNKILQST